MTKLKDQQLPIGAVVKQADAVFTNLVRRTQKNGTFNRIEWQFLNLIHEKKQVPENELIQFLSFFNQEPAIRKLIDQFKNRQLVTREAGQIVITTQGERVFAEVLLVQEEIKEKGLAGISPDQLDSTIRTLQTIMANLKEYVPHEPDLELITVESEEISDDQEQISRIIKDMEKAHNEKNPEALAGLFAEEAVFVNAAGKRLYGRKAIYESTKKVMETFMATSYARYELAGIRFLKEDVAIADVNQYPVTKTGDLLPENTAGIPTYILTKTAKYNQWQIIAGQNTLVI